MSSKLCRKIVFGLGLLLGVSLSALLNIGGDALAMDQSSINSKAVFEGVYGCFNNGAYRKTFNASEPSKFVLNNGSSDSVKLPYGLTNVGDNNLNCKEVMMGSGNTSGIKGGLIPTNARENGSDVTTVKNYFAGYSSGSNGMPSAGAGTTSTSGGIGYNAEGISEGTGGVAKKLTYSINNSNCASGEKNVTFGGSKKSITFPTVMTTDSGLKITSANDISSSGASFTSNCNNLKIKISYYSTGDQIVFEVSLNDIDYSTITYTKSGSGDLTISSPNLSLTDNNGSFINLSPSTGSENVGSTTISDYRLTWGGSGAMTLLKGINSNNKAGVRLSALSSGMGYGNLMLTKQEVYDLYTYYIEKVFGAKLVAEDQDGYSGVDINLCSSKKYKVDKTNASSPSNVYGVDSSYHFTAGPLSLDDVISTLDGLGTFDDINNGGRCNEKTEETEVTPVTPGSTNNSSSTTSKCETVADQVTDGKIGAMQWILCPTMDNMESTASWIDGLTQDWLEVKTDLYDSSSKAFEVWGTIRNIANVLMIVFMMIVVISQLTGKGIDNYGIKKMLPRLITMAILVNLSFYICEIAIDLSNILGTGLRDMFSAVGNYAGRDYIDTMTTGFMAAAGAAGTGGGAAVGVGITAVTLGASVAVAAIIAVIVLCLVILVAVMVLFLMLGAREVMIIFCIIIAPLAFAAFILPNTQNLFKKWWSVFEAALIIFPICGALSGISNLLRSMASNGTELSAWAYAVVLVLPYLGFFLLPMLLKNAIASMGKLGGALTSLGNTVRNGGRAAGQGAMKIAQQTEGYKNLQTEAARRRQQQSSQRTIDRLEALKKERGEQGLNDRETRQLARAHEVQRRLGNEEAAARTILTEKEYTGRSQADLLKDWNEAFDAGDADRMDALTNVIVSRHGPGGVNSIAESLANKNIFDKNGKFIGGDDGAMARSFNAMQANMMQNSALANAMQNKASDAFQMISSGGFVEHDVVGDDGSVTRTNSRANLDVHSANNNIATQTKDWATQSSATLRRAAASGALSPEVANDILNSTDPAVQSGIKSDATKRQVLEAAASGKLATAKDSSSPHAARAASMQWNPGTKMPDAKAPGGMSNMSYIENAAASYRDDKEKQANAELQEQRNREDARTDAINRMVNSLENLQGQNQNQSSAQTSGHTPTFDNGGNTRSSDSRISDAAHDNPFMGNE